MPLICILFCLILDEDCSIPCLFFCLRSEHAHRTVQLERIERLGEEAWAGVAAIDRGEGNSTTSLGCGQQSLCSDCDCTA